MNNPIPIRDELNMNSAEQFVTTPKVNFPTSFSPASSTRYSPLSINSINGDSDMIDSTDMLRQHRQKNYINNMTQLQLDKSYFRKLYKMDQNYINMILKKPFGKNSIEFNQANNNIGLRKKIKKLCDFTLINSLGSGAYGEVLLVKCKSTDELIILKKIVKSRILVDAWCRDIRLGIIPSEIQIMYKLLPNAHINMPQLLDFFEDDEFYYMETSLHGIESCCIELFDFIEIFYDLPIVDIKLIFKQLVSVISHLHANDIVHRDIKDENVMLDCRGQIQLIDFGSSVMTNKGPFDTFVGTIDYASPEVLKGSRYQGKPQDIWSLGVLFYTILYKETPFANVDEIIKFSLNFPEQLPSIHYVSDINDCQQFIRWILNPDPLQRPTIEEISNDAWLSS